MILKSRAKRIAPGAAAVVLFLMAFLGVRHERQRVAPKPEKNPVTASIIVEVGFERLAHVKKFSAVIEPWIAADVRSAVEGRVVDKFVEAEAEVKKGDPLLRLDETRARIALETELARHTQASQALIETERLQKNGVIPNSAAEVALAEVRASRIRLDEAREVLAQHTIRSPISGVLPELKVQSGATVEPNQILGVVSDIEKLRVFINVPQTDLPLVKLGEKIPLRVLPEGRETLRPEVLFVSPAADSKSGLFKIEAVLNNKNHAVPAKVQGIVEIETEVFPEGPVIPAGAVRFSENGTQVLREEKGKSVPVPVRLGPEIDGFYPVLEGLSAGERVFVGP